MRDDRRNYVAVGIFVIAMITALVLWIALLSGRTGSTDAYWVRYTNVTGLKQGTQILFEGYPVGLIEGIVRMDDMADPYFRVDLSIQGGWRIPSDSVAEVTASGLLGGYLVNIREGAAADTLEPGSEIRSKEAADVFAALSSVADTFAAVVDQQVTPLLESISEKAPEILGNLDQFTEEMNLAIGQINALLDPSNTGRVETILANLELTSTEVAQLSEGLGETRREFSNVLGAVDRLVVEHEDELGHTLQDLHHSLEAVARHIDGITSNLETTTRNLNEFSGQLRANPNVLIRGRDVEDGASN